MHAHFTWCTDTATASTISGLFSFGTMLYFLTWPQEGGTEPQHSVFHSVCVHFQLIKSNSN